MTVSQLLPRSEHLKPTNEIDVELLAFMERYATNLARWDLLVYFGQNPLTRDTAPEIARQLGRRPRIVQKELDDLTYLGILRARENNNGMRYELVRAPKTRQTIMRFAQRHGNGNGRN
jgi:DNA-binding MarR family transcriptional regulator